MAMATSTPPSPIDKQQQPFELNLQHGHKDLVQAVAFNTYGDRCATGSVDGKIRVFNRHKDGTWRICDTWTAHGGEVIELQWLPATVYPSILASLGTEGWFRLWAEDPSATPGRRFCSGRTSAGRPVFDTRFSRGAGGTCGNNSTTSNSNSSSTTNTTTTTTNTTATTATATATANSNSNSNSTYRSFSMTHNDETRHTFLALLTTEGRLVLYETEKPEALHEYAVVDELLVLPQRPPRGQETSFCCVFDPNPEPCYAALRAGVATDALGLAVAAMNVVKIYRSRDVLHSSYGVDAAKKELYLAAEIVAHNGLVRDLAWAPGNIRGYDMIATACQDGYVRVFRLDTPPSPSPSPPQEEDQSKLSSIDDAEQKTLSLQQQQQQQQQKKKQQQWAVSQLITPEKSLQQLRQANRQASSSSVSTSPSKDNEKPSHHHHHHHYHPSTLSAGLAANDNNNHNQAGGGHNADARLLRNNNNNNNNNNNAVATSSSSTTTTTAISDSRLLPGQVRHETREIACLNHNHRTPVWRVGFDDDGQVLGTTGDDGKLLCYRQTPDGGWAKSSEMVMVKTRMTVP